MMMMMTMMMVMVKMGMMNSGDDQHAGEETNKLKRFAYILKFCHQIILDGITPKHNPNLTQVTRSEKRRHFE